MRAARLVVLSVALAAGGAAALLVGGGAGKKPAPPPPVGKTATLELTPHQAETLALSRQLGILSLALRSLLDANKTTEISDDTDRKGAINAVRYGMSSYTTSK